MIPLRDDNPTHRTPYVVYALIAVNAVLFVYNGVTDPGPLAGFELVPFELVTGRDIGPATPMPAWMTIFSSMFMHANLLHIGGNMLYLWIFGNNIEDVLGHFKFLAFYLIAGLAAALAQVAQSPGSEIPMVGASGAIGGVLGAYLILFPRARIISVVFFVFIQVIALPASVVLGMWIILQVINSVVFSIGTTGEGGVAYAAHVGGFLSGMAMIYILGGKRLLRGHRIRP